MPVTVDEAMAKWWDEDAERLNAMAKMAREFAAKVPRPGEKQESRGFCPTGEGGGIDNSCGSGFGSMPKADELSRVSSLGGSTGAILSEDDSGNRFVVKRGDSPEHIRSEAAANAIYKAAGIPIPRTRLDETNSSSPAQVAEYVKAKPLASVSGPARVKAIKEIQKGFAVDALLANWDVVGLEEDNILVPDSGPPLRVDNGGSLTFRAMGKTKTFGPAVGELDSMRTSDQGEPIFGSLTDSQIASQIHGIVGRKDAILSATPPDLREVMSQRIDYMASWAAKKKPQSRAFCPTGDGGGVDNSCGVGKSAPEPDSPVTEKTSASPPPEPSEPSEPGQSPSDEWFGTDEDSAAPAKEMQTKNGTIKVVDRTSIETHQYLDEIENRGSELGLAVDFDTAKQLQDETEVDDDSPVVELYVGSGYGFFTGQASGDEELLDSYGYEYGTMDYDAASQAVEDRLESSWDDLDKTSEFGDEWDSLSPEDQDEKKSDWIESNRQDAEDEVEAEREAARNNAIRDMRRDLEGRLSSSSLSCCMQLYRGLRLSPHDVEKMISDGHINHTAVNSWTTSRKTVRGFGASSVLLVLRRPRAGHVYANNSMGEQEVIRPPSSMRITGVVRTKTGTVLYVDEDEDFKDM